MLKKRDHTRFGADKIMIESAQTPTVFIIEDDAVLRQSVESLVSSKGYRSESFNSVEEFLVKTSPIDQPSWILWDFHLSGRDGLSFLKDHCEQTYATPVVVLTAHADVQIAVEFMKAGASMLLRKPYEPKELLDSIESAIEWDQRMLALRKQKGRIEECFRMLTKRQETVLQMILDGSPNKAVAARLDISERTIEMERAEIFRIFQVKNAVELAVIITESRLRLENKFNEANISENVPSSSNIAQPHLLNKVSLSKPSPHRDS